MRVFLTGAVQGVSYRASLREEARERNLDGWVRALPDGRVEAVFEGPRSRIEAMIGWCHGLDGVERLDVEESEPEGVVGFEVRS